MTLGVATPVAPLDLADVVAAAVLAVPGVAGLHPGAFGEAATYLPGRRVIGVALRGERAAVHVVVAYRAPVLEVADAVRRTVAPLTGGVVDVTVEDVAASPPLAG